MAGSGSGLGAGTVSIENGTNRSATTTAPVSLSMPYFSIAAPHQGCVVVALVWPLLEFTRAMQQAGNGGDSEGLEQGQLQGPVEVPGEVDPRQPAAGGFSRRQIAGWKPGHGGVLSQRDGLNNTLSLALIPDKT